MNSLAVFGLGPIEVIVILAIILLIFGANRLPGVGSALGSGLKNFRKALRENEDDEEKKEKKSIAPQNHEEKNEKKDE